MGGPPVFLALYSTPDKSIHELVRNDAAPDDASPGPTFVDVAGLFEHAGRGEVPLENLRLDPHEPVAGDRELGDRLRRGRRDAASPVRLGDPVAHRRGQPLDVVAEPEPDAADELPIAL